MMLFLDAGKDDVSTFYIKVKSTLRTLHHSRLRGQYRRETDRTGYGGLVGAGRKQPKERREDSPF